MIRISKWPGLLTAASPYILPPGASVEQVNAQSATPGQLSVRKGMLAVGHTCNGAGCTGASVTGGLLEIWGYSPGVGGTERIFGLTTAGELVVIDDLAAYP